MNLYSIIKLLSFLVHAVLGLYALRKDRRHRLNQVFSLVVFSIAVMEFGYFMLLVGLSRAVWMRIVLIGQCLAPGSIILLTLIYGREDYENSLKTGKFYLIAVYFVSLVFLVAALFGILDVKFSDELPMKETSWQHVVHYGLIFNRTSSFFVAFLLICTLMALINLENTYRQARQGGRSIKYPIIVFIGALSFHLLIYSLALGFSYVQMEILIVASITLIAANVCVAFPVIRPELKGSRIYVGRAVIAKSYTLLLAGIYLLIIGMLGKIVQIIGKNLSFFLAFFIAFFVLLALMAGILSRPLKRRFQSFIEKNFYRNRYDYRREWENFSKRVFSHSASSNTKELLQEVLDTISETIGANSVSIWMLDAGWGKPIPYEAGYGVNPSPTMLDKSGVEHQVLSVGNDEFLDWLWRYGSPVRIDDGQCKAGGTFSEPPDIPDVLLSVLDEFGTQKRAKNGDTETWRRGDAETRRHGDMATRRRGDSRRVSASPRPTVPDGVVVPVITENRLIAIMILGGRETPPYSQEDMDLLETMANQISIAIMNARTSQELALSRELESLYRLSTMLLHDLKSSASMLSLVIQNAADNFDNPEFRKDALGTMSNVVDRIQKLILRLSAAPRKPEIQPTEAYAPADMIEIISGAVDKSGIRNLTRIEVVEELSPTPLLMVDSENMERVILNLIMNAIEAIEDEGVVTIRCRVADYEEKQGVRACEEKTQDSTETGRRGDGEARERGGEEARRRGDSRRVPDGVPPPQKYAVVSVSDTGCGMSQEFIRERLFRPFQTSKEKGLGIGLYQCKAIVDACGGVIDVRSHQGVGSTFTVKLPIQRRHGGEEARGRVSASLFAPSPRHR